MNGTPVPIDINKSADYSSASFAKNIAVNGLSSQKVDRANTRLLSVQQDNMFDRPVSGHLRAFNSPTNNFFSTPNSLGGNDSPSRNINQ